MEKSNLPNIRLSIYGCIKAAGQSVSNAVEKFDWVNAIADSAILAAITFFGALGGSTAVGVEFVQSLGGAGIAAGAQFFAVLAAKRKLVKTEC